MILYWASQQMKSFKVIKEDKMKKIKNIVLVAAVLSGFIWLTGCGDSSSKNNTENEKQVKAYNVEVVSAKGITFDDVISAVGTVKPIMSANLSYQEGGIIEKILKKKGNYVYKGDVIAEIDNEVLKANLNAAKAQYELAKMNFEKQSKIFAEKINSEFQYLESKYTMEQAKANLDLIQARYEKTFIKAPFSGIVDQTYYEEGEFAPPGTPIVYLISNGGRLKVEVGISEKFAGKVKLGADVNVLIKEISPDFIKGKISFIGSSVSSKNRTFPVEVVLYVNQKNIKPEMTAELQVINKSFKDVIVISEEIVERVDDGYSVFVAEDGKAVSRKIKVLNRNNNKVAVESGLKEGDKVIVVGYQNLVDGDRVNVVKEVQQP